MARRCPTRPTVRGRDDGSSSSPGAAPSSVPAASKSRTNRTPPWAARSSSTRKNVAPGSPADGLAGASVTVPSAWTAWMRLTSCGAAPPSSARPASGSPRVIIVSDTSRGTASLHVSPWLLPLTITVMQSSPPSWWLRSVAPDAVGPATCVDAAGAEPEHSAAAAAMAATAGPLPMRPQSTAVCDASGRMSRRLLILGSTGSIGTQALEIVAHSDELDLVGLSAQGNWEQLIAQAREFAVERVALTDADAAERAREKWSGEVLAGPEGLVQLVVDSGADLVLNALVGSAGLGPTVATLGEGMDLALANKESLVVGGELVMQLSEATGGQVIPVDSEHSALHQLISGEAPGTVAKLVLTASGGPFRGRSREQLESVTVEEALKHPTWAMGGKITIDSSTLMNKGLELIEAHHLFGVPYERIDVVVHPQSIVHSLITLNDGAALAHLGHPDMRVPISYALHFPERADVPVEPLDLPKLGQLTFEEPDEDAFPCLRLARSAAAEGGTAPCVMNAANEVAVQAFLDGQLAFNGIPEMIERALETVERQPLTSFDDLYLADAQARRVVEGAVA